MRALLLFLFFLVSVPASFADQRCDAHVAVQRAELGDLSLVYQSVGAPRDPALLLVMGLGGQLIHWPDDVVEALCRQGFRVIRYDNRDVGLSRCLTDQTVRYASSILRDIAPAPGRSVEVGLRTTF